MLLAAKWLHVVIAAAWFGHKLLVPSDLRQISTAPPEYASVSLARIDRAERLGIATGIGTLLSGLLLVFLIGPSVVRPAIYVGLALVLTAIAVGGVVARPASIRFRRAVADADPDGTAQAASTLSTVLMVESGLWAGALLSMLV